MFDDRRLRATCAAATCLVLAAVLTACGGGGGSSGTPATVAAPGPSPVATPSPQIPSVAAINGVAAANANVVFSCGCTGQAGTTTTDGNGKYAIAPSVKATPAVPSPIYTAVPGRNYLDVITASNGAQAWDIAFLGATPAHNHLLNATNTSDKYTTAAALYVFYNSISSSKQDAFDTWDFTTIAGWVSALQSVPLPQETTLLNDIVSAQAGGRSLYPSNGAAWAPPGTVPNATIETDLDNVKSAVTAAGLITRLPQQCAPAGDPCAVPTP